MVYAHGSEKRYSPLWRRRADHWPNSAATSRIVATYVRSCGAHRQERYLEDFGDEGDITARLTRDDSAAVEEPERVRIDEHRIEEPAGGAQ